MSYLGSPNTWPGTTTQGYMCPGAVQKPTTGSKGSPTSWPGTTTVNYETVGAVQKQPDVSATASITLDAITVSANAVTTNNATASITLGDVTVAATAVTTNNATASITLDDIGISATGVTTNNATAAITLDPVTIAATVTTIDPQVELAKQVDWLLKLALADEVHDANAGTITKLEAGTSTELLVKSFTGRPFSDLVLTHVSSGDDTYSGSTTLADTLTKVLLLRKIREADEIQTGSTLTKYEKGTATQVVQKQITGTPLVDLAAVE